MTEQPTRTTRVIFADELSPGQVLLPCSVGVPCKSPGPDHEAESLGVVVLRVRHTDGSVVAIVDDSGEQRELEYGPNATLRVSVVES